MVSVHSFWTFLWHWLLLCCLSFIAVAFLRWSHKLLWITKSSVLTAYHLKANREANWWKEKFYFGCWQPRGEGQTPVQWLTLPSLSPLTLSGQELFIGRGRGLHAETAVSSDSQPEISHLVVWSAASWLNTVSRQLQGPFFPISWWSVLRTVATCGYSLVNHVVNFLHDGGFRIYSCCRGTKGTWLCLVTTLLLFSLVGLSLCFCFFFTSLIFWLKFFYRQKESWGHGGQGP